MKKTILFVAFASLFTTFSSTPDEFESQSKKDTEKVINHQKTTYADGPDDGIIIGKPPIKPPTS